MQQQLQQQQSHHQQLLNRPQHQQINTQTIPMQQHHNFPFHQAGHSDSQQQQVYYAQPRVQQQLSGPRFHSRALQSKPYIVSQNAPLNDTCLQAQQQQANFQLTGGGQAFSGSGPEDPNAFLSIHMSSMGHSLPACSVNSATAYQPAQFPAYPGEPKIPSLSQQSLSTVSMPRPITNTASIPSTLPDLSGTVCQFPSVESINQQHTRAPVNQAEECAFRALRPQNNCKSSEMFGESTSCYPNMATRLPHEQPQSCGAINTNRYQELGDNLLPSVSQDGDLEGLEPPDLLPDLLPQLEAAFSQQDESNCSWADCSQDMGHENRKPPFVEYKEEKVMQDCILHYLLFFRSTQIL